MKKKVTKIIFSSLALFFLISGTVNAASFYLAPQSSEFKHGCTNSINIMIDTEGQDATAADAILNYNPNEIEVTSLRSGDAFQTYLGNSYTGGKITLTGFNVMTTLNGVAKFGTFKFKNKNNVESTNINFDFTLGETTDSNIADANSNDILSSTTDGSYSFVSGPCQPDTQAPRIITTDPSQGETDVPLDSNIDFRITDNQSGVDVSSLIVTVNGVAYTNDGENSYSLNGEPKDYFVTVNPIADFSEDSQVDVQIEAKDIDGNVMNNYNFYFNKPGVDRNAPFVTSMVPLNNDFGVPLDTNITFNIADITPGVALNSVVVQVDGREYTAASNEFSYTGDQSNYRIVINPAEDLTPDKRIHVRVEGKDTVGNVMAPYNSYFNRELEKTCADYGCCDCDTVCAKDDEDEDEDEEGEEEDEDEEETVFENDFLDGIIANILPPDDYKQVAVMVGTVKKATIDNPTVEKVNEAVDVPVLTVASATSIAALASVSATGAAGIGVLPYLQFLFSQPLLMLFSRRKRANWGVVYNSVTKKPVDLAIVRVYRSDTNKIVQTRVTDKQGRYLFNLRPGRYYITVEKKHFKYPSTLLKGRRIDNQFEDVYYGEEIEIAEKNTAVVYPIAIDPANQLKSNLVELRTFFVRKGQLAITLIGPILAIVSYIINPEIWMGGAALAHIGMYFIFRRLAMAKTGKNYGEIKDAATKTPLNTAIVRVFDTKFNKLLDTRVTDSKGRYSFLVGNDKYYVTSEKPGFFAKRTQIYDMQNEKEGYLATDIFMHKHKLGEEVRTAQKGSQPVTLRTSVGRQMEEQVDGVVKVIRNSSEKFSKDLKIVNLEEMHEDYYDVDPLK